MEGWEEGKGGRHGGVGGGRSGALEPLEKEDQGVCLKMGGVQFKQKASKTVQDSASLI